MYIRHTHALNLKGFHPDCTLPETNHFQDIPLKKWEWNLEDFGGFLNGLFSAFFGSWIPIQPNQPAFSTSKDLGGLRRTWGCCFRETYLERGGGGTMASGQYQLSGGARMCGQNAWMIGWLDPFFILLVEEGSVEERMKICMEIVSWRFLEVVFSFVKWMLMDGWGRLNEVLELKLQSEGGDDDDSCGQGFLLRVSSCLSRCNVS